MKKYYYLIQLQYLGFRYHGWQKQPDVKTVQKMVEKTVRFVLEHEDFKVLGSARTDAKVSANNAAFELFLKAPIDTELFFKAFNENLPQDIRATGIKEVDRSFNIINSPKYKEYIYLFSFGEKNHPFSAPFMTYISEKLDIGLMEEGARLFEGLHNFQNYCYKPKENTMFNREIKYSRILENDVYTANFFPEKSFLYKVIGKGFMRHQVRLMVGALINLGKGKFDMDYIRYSLTEKIEDPLNNIAPSSGLILNKIEFDDDL
ncbi:tRNA pseudouridine synthase A [Flexithrix dorotheae]|uniref:tRNA pseudouridine synthase A n=1 Tax=Flexithrix dorotheae TaxID=70993 RepID=UPI00037D3BA1|nr:hypothetical protein [Flexithrix dorotheae]